MEYGTKHEIDGVATMVARIIPALFPTLDYYEEGCVRMALNDNPSFFVVSPDGMFCAGSDETPKFMYENKCKVKNPFATDVYYEIPKYYIPQILCEMKSYNCDSLLFSCWSEKSTVVFKVEFDEELWVMITTELSNVYCKPSKKRPSKFSETVPALRSMIDNFAQTNITFLAEFPSCVARKGTDDEYNGGEVTHPYHNMEPSSTMESLVEAGKVLNVLHASTKWTKEVYSLCRTVATEILVFMVNDHDRRYHSEINNAHVVAYALKGPSMSNDIFRQMVQHVIQECEKNGLIVKTTSADGQWHKYGVRDEDNNPLTLLQLQKDFWALQKKKPKSTILKEFRERYKVKSLEDVRIEKLPSSPIIVHGHSRDSNLNVFDRDLQLDYQTQAQSKETVELNASENSNLGITNQVDINAFVPDAIYSEDDLNTIDTLLAGTDTEMRHGATFVDNVDINYDTSYLYDVGMDMQISTYESFGNVSMEELMVVSTETHESNNQQMDISSVIGSAYDKLYNDFYYEETTEANSVRNSFVTVDAIDTTGQSVSTDNELYIAANTDPDTSMLENITNVGSENDDIYEMMFTALKSPCATKTNKWDAKTKKDLETSLHTQESACKDLTKKELLICINALTSDTENNTKISSSWNKAKLYTCLSSLIRGEVIDRPPKRKRRFNPPMLVQMASRRMNCIPKEILAIILCEDRWSEYYQQWAVDSPMEVNVMIKNVCENYTLFSQPSIDKNGCIRCHFTDCCHILTCLRTKICTTGVFGFKKDAWIMAAKSDETQLNIAIVVECIDKQSVAFAKRVFAEDVEKFMTSNGFHKEATFIRLIRRWFESEDEPGLDAIERCQRRVDLRSYLLSGVNFGRFPPHTQYVKGIPIVTYESLLTNIDRKIQLFKLLPNGNYNVRALGTQEVEQFFSTVRDLDPSGLGTPKPDDIPSMIATASLLDNTRMNPTRPFYMTTTRAAVYPEADFHTFTNTEMSHDNDETNVINVHNNFFDKRDRRRTLAKRKSGKINLPELPSNRVTGVRQYHRCDESKILAHQRKGMDDI